MSSTRAPTMADHEESEKGRIDERRNRIDERSSPHPPLDRTIGVLVLAGVLAVTGVGVAIRVALGEPAHLTALGRPLFRDLLAVLSWVPVGWGVVVLTLRYPPSSIRPLGSALIHLPGLAVAAITVNLLTVMAWWSAGLVSGERSPGHVILEGTLHNVYGNALLYLLLVTATMWVSSSRSTHGVEDAGEGTGEDEEGRGAGPEHLPVRHRGRTVLIDPARIDWIEASGDYAAIHVGEQRFLLGERMKELEERLSPLGFLRVHRSAIVNRSRIREVGSAATGGAVLRMANGTEVQVSRRQRERVLREVGLRRKST